MALLHTVEQVIIWLDSYGWKCSDTGKQYTLDDRLTFKWVMPLGNGRAGRVAFCNLRPVLQSRRRYYDAIKGNFMFGLWDDDSDDSDQEADQEADQDTTDTDSLAAAMFALPAWAISLGGVA